ncbi:proliferating cell nuclear antigen (pcna) [Candidatus Woesearchaeota archaeon ex4484_78]|nr:MAG: proliferating cell nuclear antigen (pcna) [Candidatus Woesearchaeota archaeon ex4484_78]
MRLVIADSSLLKDSISVISDLVSEARFKISRDGLELIAMDPANVAMVVFKLLSSCFVEYDLEKDVEIAVNLTSFKQILKRSSPNDIVSLELTEDNKLKVQFKGSTTRTFSLPLIELEEKEQRVPNLSFPVLVSTDSSILNAAIADADIVAESVTFGADPEKFTVAAEGDSSKVFVEIKPNEKTSIKSETSANVRAKYSIEYLKKMMNGSKLASDVNVFFNQNYPLKLEYKVVDKLLLSFILAPRVEND